MKGAANALTVVATPIGNLGDLSPRAADALCAVDLVACEDTRRTATLLRHVGASPPMVALHRHNEVARGEDLLGRMRDGTTVALVSDAGMPGVSDPGARLVAAAHRAGLSVSVIPGPGAVETAVAASGFVVESFLFVGFLPRSDEGRAAVWSRADEAAAALVAFESPSRLPASLASLAHHDPDRPVALCRELSKLHEEVAVDSAAALARRFAAPARGEVTLVVDGAPAPAARDDAALEAGLRLMLDAGLGPRAAAAAVTALGVAPRNAAYRLATRIAASSGED